MTSIPTGVGASAIAALAALIWYNSSITPKRSKIYVGDGFIKQHVLPKCRIINQPFRPTPWAVNTHFQTGLGLMRTVSTTSCYSRQLFQASDGGTLALDWWDGSDRTDRASATAPILLVVHGINGGSHEGYCKWVCQAAAQKGWRAVVLNMRGCNGLELSTARGYAATLTPDIKLAVESVQARFPQAPVCASGYSLGGLALTKYLAEADRGLHGAMGSGLRAAAIVSSPVCLFNSSGNLAQPWTMAYIYNLAVAFKLREYVKHHRPAIQGHTPFDIDAALQTTTVAELEDVGVPSQFGYKNRQEYYEQASSLNYFPVIQTPTLVLVSEDDPFLGVLPDLECAKNPNTLLVATPHGGHVAFLQGMWPLSQAFMDDAVMEFLNVVVQETRHKAAGRLAQPGMSTPQPHVDIRRSPEASLTPLTHGEHSDHLNNLSYLGDRSNFSSLGNHSLRSHSVNEHAVTAAGPTVVGGTEARPTDVGSTEAQPKDGGITAGPTDVGRIETWSTDVGTTEVRATGMGLMEAEPRDLDVTEACNSHFSVHSSTVGRCSEPWSVSQDSSGASVSDLAAKTEASSSDLAANKEASSSGLAVKKEAGSCSDETSPCEVGSRRGEEEGGQCDEERTCEVGDQVGEEGEHCEHAPISGSQFRLSSPHPTSPAMRSKL